MLQPGTGRAAQPTVVRPAAARLQALRKRVEEADAWEAKAAAALAAAAGGGARLTLDAIAALMQARAPSRRFRPLSPAASGPSGCFRPFRPLPALLAASGP